VLRPANSFFLSDFLHLVYAPSRIDLAAGTLRQMEITIRAFERWAGRKLTIADLSEDLLRQFLMAFRALPRSASTTNSKRCQLLALWRCAWDEEYLAAPPRTRKVRRLKSFAIPPEAWTAEEVGKILRVVQEIPGETAGLATSACWRSLLLVIYDTGARKNEALATAPKDLSLVGRWIALSSRKNGRRICPLHADTIAAVQAIWSAAREKVWPYPFSREALDKRFRAILTRAAVAFGRGRGGLFHKLRRTSGTLVEANGGDGAKQIGDTRQVFEQHYLDRRLVPASQLASLPRPG
jgi:integrase